MTEVHWDYFGRSGANGITELFRAPISIPDGFEKFAKMQRLRKDGHWHDASADTALKNDWASGWFDFDENRISPEDAEDYVRRWKLLSDWPGRP